MTVHRVLVVSDDPRWRATCSTALAPVCEFEFAETASGACAALDRRAFALALVSFRLRRDHGLTVVQALSVRADTVPVLVVATLEDTYNRKAAYSNGASAVLYRCGADELRMRVEKELARIAPARRTGNSAAKPPRTIRLGRVKLDVVVPCIVVGGREIALSPAEHRIMLILAYSFGTRISRAAVARIATPFRVSVDATSALDNHLARLRRKLVGTGLVIETIKSAGYALRPLDPAIVADESGPVSTVRRTAPSGIHLRTAQLDAVHSTRAPSSWPPSQRAAKG